MARGIDITLERGDGRARLQLGGIPFETIGDLIEERFGAPRCLIDPADNAIERKVPAAGGAEGWMTLPTGEGIGLATKWTILDVSFIKEEEWEGAVSAAARKGDRRTQLPGSFLSVRSSDGGEVITIEAEDQGLLRDLLGTVLRMAIEAGGEARLDHDMPEAVLDRAWSDALQGIHLNPNRKVLRGDDLVLVGNLGTDFHRRGRPKGGDPVRVIRLVLPRRGVLHWDAPVELPARVYVREHLDDWPGCLGVVIAVAALTIGAVLILFRAWIFGLFSGE